MSIAEVSMMEEKREHAFRLLRGEGAVDGQVVQDTTPAPPNETIVDPEWGRACLSCEIPKPWDAFHGDSSRKSGRRSRCAECVARERKGRSSAARSHKKKAEVEVETRTQAETDARICALERLVEMHPTQFAHMLYSEQVRLGVRQIREEPRLSSYKPHRSWASTRS